MIAVCAEINENVWNGVCLERPGKTINRIDERWYVEYLPSPLALQSLKVQKPETRQAGPKLFHSGATDGVFFDDVK